MPFNNAIRYHFDAVLCPFVPFDCFDTSLDHRACNLVDVGKAAESVVVGRCLMYAVTLMLLMCAHVCRHVYCGWIIEAIA